jgi:hypothetical protein
MSKKPSVPTPVLASNKKYPQAARPSTKREMPRPSDLGQRPRLWAFSFRFWEQRDFFGVPTRAGWFVSLLSRLKELGKLPVDDFKFEKQVDELRYHPIDWGSKNIPVQRRELAWIASDYLNNEVEFPFLQFHISRATGRVIGFWDESDVFNIILLDERHNMQPSGKNDYQVRDTWTQRCDYSSLLMDVEKVKETNCSAPECATNVAIRKVPSNIHDHEVLIIPFSKRTVADAEQLINDGKAKTIGEIFEHGVLSIMLKDDPADPPKK